MNTGFFDKEIIIKQLTGSTVDNDGVETPTYGNTLTIKAEVHEMSGTERFRSAGDAQWHKRVARFKFWNTRKTEYTDVITYEGDDWDIIGVRNEQRYGIKLTEVTAQAVNG